MPPATNSLGLRSASQTGVSAPASDVLVPRHDVMSVAQYPGQQALTMIDRGFSSFASTRVYAESQALLMPGTN